MLTITPIKPLGTTVARIINFLAWWGGLTFFSLVMFLLSPLYAGAISAAVSLVILTYLLVRKNVIDISLDAENKLLRVRHLPWFGKMKETTYPISSVTEVAFIPANNEIPVLGTRWTGRYKLVIKAPMWYELEFFTSDYSPTDLQILQGGIRELQEKR